MIELLPALLFSTFLGAVVQGVTGFAFAIIFLAIMQYVLPYTQLLSLSALLALVMLSINVWIYRHHIVWKWIPLPLLINFMFTLGAIRLLHAATAFPYWHKLLGVVFIVLSVYMYYFQHNIHIKPTLPNMLLFCGTGGILGGLFGVGGPPVVLYFLSIAKNKEQYLSTTQMFFFFNMLYDFFGRAANGMVTFATFQYAALCIVPIVVGLWIGRRILRKVNGDLLKKLVYLLMFADGWYMLLC